MINDSEHLFMGLFAICVSSSVKCVLITFAHFLTELLIFVCLTNFLLWSFKNSLYIVGTSPFCVCGLQVFSLGLRLVISSQELSQSKVVFYLVQFIHFSSYISCF